MTANGCLKAAKCTMGCQVAKSFALVMGGRLGACLQPWCQVLHVVACVQEVYDVTYTSAIH